MLHKKYGQSLAIAQIGYFIREFIREVICEFICEVDIGNIVQGRICIDSALKPYTSSVSLSVSLSVRCIGNIVQEHIYIDITLKPRTSSVRWYTHTKK